MQIEYEHKDRSHMIRVLGWIYLAFGVFMALLSPLENLCFPLFSEGGRFHYEGFGYGSLLNVIIVAQIVGYYAAAAIFIPLGYGHLKLKRWARSLSVSLLFTWLAIGAPVVLAVFFVLAGTKELSLFGLILWSALLAAAYFVLPFLLLRFYKGKNAVWTWEEKDPKTYWLDALPTPVLTLAILGVFYIIILYMFILMNGIFPVFGFLLSGFPGILALGAAILGLAWLVWGLLCMRRWAFLGISTFILLFTASVFVTFCSLSYSGILGALALPKTEHTLFTGLPLQGAHFALIIGFPFIGGCIASAYSRKHFKGRTDKRASL